LKIKFAASYLQPIAIIWQGNRTKHSLDANKMKRCSTIPLHYILIHSQKKGLVTGVTKPLILAITAYLLTAISLSYEAITWIPSATR
jgi:hypothetical protein